MIFLNYFVSPNTSRAGKGVGDSSIILLRACVSVRAAHPHENVPGGVEVSSNPSPIVLSKGARYSDPYRGQELRILV